MAVQSEFQIVVKGVLGRRLKKRREIRKGEQDHTYLSKDSFGKKNNSVGNSRPNEFEM
jgi:hypothetical protein